MPQDMATSQTNSSWESYNRTVLNLLEKKQLLDPSVLPEEIERRRLEVCSWNTKINTTSLVSVKSGRAEHGIGANFLVVGDFWMTD